MFAVTITEDPRDGYYTYWVPSGGDWPQIAVTDTHLLITDNGIPCQDGPAQDPMIYMFDADAIAAGKSSVPNWRYFKSDLGINGGVRPVVMHGPQGGIAYFAAPDGDSMSVWAVKPAIQQAARPPLLHASVKLTRGEFGMIRGSPVSVGGKLYLAGAHNAWC